MKTRGTRFLMILGAGLAIMAFVVIYVVMNKGLSLGNSAQETANVPQTVELTTIAVVNQDIPAFTLLDGSNVVTEDVDASTIVTGTIADPTSLYGKMTRVPIARNQPIQANMLTEAGFSSILIKGERAFSLALPERAAFAGAVSENDRIDVLWTATFKNYVQVPGADGQVTYEPAPYTTTKTLLQDIKVLRVLRLAQVPTTPNQNNASASNGDGAQQASSKAVVDYSTAGMYVDNAPYTTVLILAVNDQQAEVLQFARSTGIVDLTLRSSASLKDDAGNLVKDEKGQAVVGDHDVEKTTGVTINTLITDYGVPCPLADCNK